MKIFIVSNMYPDKKHPSYGIFVKKFCDQLELFGYTYTKSVMLKQDSSFMKALAYIGFYFKTFIRLLFCRYDIIYIHYASHSSIPVLLATAIRKKRIFTNVHGSDVVPENSSQTKMQKFTQKILSKSDTIIVPSAYFEEYTKKKFKLYNKTFIIYPSSGVDSKIFFKKEKNDIKYLNTKFDIDTSKINVGFVGRISAGKGWDTFLDAIELMNIQELNNFHFYFIGTGPEINDFKQKIYCMNNRDYIDFVDKLLPQNEVANYFSIIDFLVFPTRREGESLGLVPLEAMACGTPVIASDFAACKEYIEDGNNGFKFQVGNPESLKDVLIKIKSIDSFTYATLSDNAVKTSYRYLDINITKRIKKIFDR